MGLNTEATETQIIERINALKAEKQTALNSAQSPDPARFVPIETHQLALNRAESAEATLTKNKEAALTAEGQALVEQSITDGKMAPANKDHYLALCRDEAGLETVKQLMAAAPEDTDGGQRVRVARLANLRRRSIPRSLRWPALLGLSDKAMTEAKAAHTAHTTTGANR